MIFAICDNTDYGGYRRIDRCVMGANQAFGDANCASNETAWAVRTSVSGEYSVINASTGNASLIGPTPCTPSKTTIAADALSTLSLSQMRANTQIDITGPHAESFVASGSIDLSFSVPGRYTITATAPFPALPKIIAIHAT